MSWNIPRIEVAVSDPAIAASCAGCGIANYVRPSEAPSDGGSSMVKTKLWEVKANSGYSTTTVRFCGLCLGIAAEKMAEAKGKAGG